MAQKAYGVAIADQTGWRNIGKIIINESNRTVFIVICLKTFNRIKD